MVLTWKPCEFHVLTPEYMRLKVGRGRRCTVPSTACTGVQPSWAQAPPAERFVKPDLPKRERERERERVEGKQIERR